MRISRVNYVNSVRERIAKLIGAQTDECVLVPNASHGIATILRNFTFNEGDILVGGVTVEHATVTSFCGLTCLLSNDNISIHF